MALKTLELKFCLSLYKRSFQFVQFFYDLFCNSIFMVERLMYLTYICSALCTVHSAHQPNRCDSQIRRLRILYNSKSIPSLRCHQHYLLFIGKYLIMALCAKWDNRRSSWIMKKHAVKIVCGDAEMRRMQNFPILEWI